MHPKHWFFLVATVENLQSSWPPSFTLPVLVCSHVVFVCMPVFVCVVCVCHCVCAAPHDHNLGNNNRFESSFTASLSAVHILFMSAQHTQQYSMLSTCAESFNTRVAQNLGSSSVVM